MFSMYLKRAIIVLTIGLIPGLSVVFGQDKIELATEIETRPGFYFPSRSYYSVPVIKASLKLKKEPVYQSTHPKYHKLVIGNVEQKENIAVVIDEAEGEPPRIYVDTNNNGDLTDDGDPSWPNESTSDFRKDVTIKATFVSEGKTQEAELPYRLIRMKYNQSRVANGGDVVLYNPHYGRSGMLKIDGKEFLVSVLTTGQGLYQPLDNQTILIDLNRDGKFDRTAFSPEYYYGREPFNIDGETYRVASASPLGDKITIEVSPAKVAARYYIKANEPVPEFSFATLEGTNMKMSDLKGRYVLLDFWATWCGPCIATMPTVRKLYGEFDRSQFEVIGISTDGGRGDGKSGDSHDTTKEDVIKFIPKSPIIWPVTYDEGGKRIARLFNINSYPVHILIDPKGIIRLVASSGDEENFEKMRQIMLQNKDK